MLLVVDRQQIGRPSVCVKCTMSRSRDSTGSAVGPPPLGTTDQGPAGDRGRMSLGLSYRMAKHCSRQARAEAGAGVCASVPDSGRLHPLRAAEASNRLGDGWGQLAYRPPC